MAFYRWGLCLTIIDGFSPPRGIYSFLPIHRHIFSLYIIYKIVRLYWTLSHLTEPTQSNSKHSIDSLTMHSHPFNTMFLCICNTICHCIFVPCHIYDECYMDNFIKHAYHQCILGNYIKHEYNFHTLIHSCQYINTHINISSNKYVMPCN